MSSSRTLRAGWNFASQGVCVAASLVVALASVPFLLRHLGTERFGAVKVVADWFSYIALLELGQGISLLAALSKAVGQGDEAAGRRVVVAGWWIYLQLSALMVLAGTGLAATMPFLIKRVQLGPTEVWLAAAISAIPLAYFAAGTVGRLLCSVRQRDYINNLLFLVQSLFTTTLLIILASLGYGLPGQAAGVALGQLPTVLYLFRETCREFPGFWRQRTDTATAQKLWSSNWPAFFFNLSGRVGLMSDNIVLAAIVGPLAVAPFFLTQRLITIAQGQLQGLGNSAWAGLAELHYRNERALFETRLLELTGMVSGLGFALLAPLGSFNASFITRWLGASIYSGDAVTLLACTNGWLLALFSLWNWLITGSGELRRWLPYALAFTGVNLLASIGATFAFGLPGPLLGTLVSLLAVQAWASPKVLQAIFGLSWQKLWGAALQPALWGVPFATGCVWCSRRFLPSGWIGFGAAIMVSGSAGLAFWWQFSLDMAMRRQWKMRLATMLGRSQQETAPVAS